MILNKVVEGKGQYGYNAATGVYGDMLEMGILDPTKVTRSALQNAASVSGLIITTEAMVAEVPKDEPAGMPGGGGNRCATTAESRFLYSRDLALRDRRRPSTG